MDNTILILVYSGSLLVLNYFCKYSNSEIEFLLIITIVVRLWLRGRASVLLSEGCWFSSLGLLVQVSLYKIMNPKTAPNVLVVQCVNVWVTVSCFGQKCLLNVNDTTYHLFLAVVSNFFIWFKWILQQCFVFLFFFLFFCCKAPEMFFWTIELHTI